ncbi:azurin [Stenotrophomonas rhizophila]|uniref:azurin n=1 Tax=Stenotrophomonas rhizophila TaxID=216778 RepID=UPI001E46F399|nr:azurin [Stenotrophomonas rhizophila]MCC7635665.1 azurin [Stenotrophomonas rhizophila]MCC7664780.1 azurin [Stenotrophomonas rhizophila]
METAVKLLVPVVLAGLALAPAAHARVCAVSIDSTDQMRFSQDQIKIAADCSQVRLTLRHTGKLAATAMGHNWVLTRTPDYQPVAMAGMRMTLADSYLPKADARVLAHTAVIGGGQSTSVTFSTARLAKGGDYTFFCSFPGHFAMMKGRFVFG